MHRFWISLLLLTVIAGAENAAAQTPDNPPATTPPAVNSQLPQVEPPSFWTKRRVGLVAGFGTAAAAGVMAWQRERDLRVRKSELQSLPSGANDEWARQFDEAEGVMKDRNFWAGVAASVGGVTIAYMFASRSHPGRPRGIRPLQGGAALVWSF
jgi:hypothetical protein